MFRLGYLKMQGIKNKTKKLLSIYFCLNILLCAVFFLFLGVSFAGEGSEKIWYGEEKALLYYEDAQKLIIDFLDHFKRGSAA